MGKQEFEDAIANISNSFSLSKEKIGAPNKIISLLPRELVEIADKFDRGEPISDADILEYRKVWQSEDPLIDENGKPFVFYIHDFSKSHWGEPNRVFHVAWCSVLERMDNNGRRARYVKKSDLSHDDFIVDYGNDKTGIRQLPACIPCMKKMQDIVAPSGLYYQRNGMDIRKFFNLYGKQDLLDISNPMYSVDYPANWDQISYATRERAGWKCSVCKKDFSNNKSGLHVHHKDGRRGVVHAGNLEVVCAQHHSEKFGHGHMKKFLYQSVSSKSMPRSKKIIPEQISKSGMNKLMNFIQYPERYAIGTQNSIQKAKEIRIFFESSKGVLDESTQIAFQQALSVYVNKLKEIDPTKNIGI